jgi:hypothetical protein
MAHGKPASQKRMKVPPSAVVGLEVRARIRQQMYGQARIGGRVHPETQRDDEP